MRTIMAVINVPIFAVLLMGVISKRAPALAGYVGLVTGMVFFFVTKFILNGDFGLFQVHWLNLVGMNLILMLVVMTAIRYWKPMDKPYVQIETHEVEVNEWKYAKLASWVLIFLFITLYTVFSPLGLTSETGSWLKVVVTISGSMLILYSIYSVIKKISDNKSSNKLVEMKDTVSTL